MKKIIILVAITVLGIGIYSGISTPNNSNTTEVLSIGAALPLTGPGAAIGEIMHQGLRLKVDELRKEGFNLELHVEDTSSDSRTAISAFNNLVNIKKAKVVFTITSAASLTILPLVESRKDVILWADASVPALTEGTSNVLRHSGTAEHSARLLAQAIQQDTTKKKIAIIHQQDDWGVAFKRYIVPELQKAGIEVISEQIDNTKGDFRTSILRIKNEKPDAIVYGVFGPAMGVVLKQTRELGYTKQLYSGVGFNLTPDASKIAGESAKGLLYEKYPINEEFVKDYKETYQQTGSPLAYIPYTDIEILMNAVKQTKSTDPRVLIKYIKGMKTFIGKYETVKIQENGDILIPTTIETW